MMKKIWPWMGLLLLLMILCIVTKVDTIHITRKPQAISAATAGSHQNVVRPIDFDIVQKDNAYQLSGHFKDSAQQQRLAKAFAGTKHALRIGNTSTNQTLVAEEVIVLVEKMIPHFTRHYKDGRIRFHDNKLSVYGTADSYAAKREMERILNNTVIPTEDNSVVVLPKKPVSFEISKHEGEFSLSGHFQNSEQINALQGSASKEMRVVDIVKDPIYTDSENAISFAQHILPLFNDLFTEGYIKYSNHRFVVNGLAKDQAGLNHMKSLLAQSKIPVVDQTKLDPTIAQQKAAEEKAALLALKKAEEKAAQEAKLRAEKIRKEAEEAKQRIQSLLEVENIEFEVAKSRLTQKGQQTVDKLAAILKKYPDIRIKIAGHTDSDGSAEFNQNLSQGRVNTVKKELVHQGIAASRVEAIGYGESKPLVPNTSKENKQKNRRVEITIIGE